MGAAEKVRLFGSPMPHDFDFFNRQETYRWFNRWLAHEDRDMEEAEFDESAPEALNCTSTGQVLTSLGGRSVVRLNSDRLRAPSPRIHWAPHQVRPGLSGSGRERSSPSSFPFPRSGLPSARRFYPPTLEKAWPWKNLCWKRNLGSGWWVGF